MKSIYYFCTDAEKFTCETVVFRVFIGTSKREQIRKSLLESYCADCGYFFRQRDDDSDFWLKTLSRDLRPDSNAPELYVKSASINVCTLYRLIIDGELSAYSAKVCHTIGRHKILNLCDAKYFAEHIGSVSPTSAFSLRRKYLSHGMMRESDKAVFAIVGVLLLFILDAIVSNVFGL